MFDEWKEQHRVDSIKNRMRAYQALIMSYHVIVHDGNRRLDMARWLQLLKVAAPTYTRDEASELFMLLDADGRCIIHYRLYSYRLITTHARRTRAVVRLASPSMLRA
jgi:hypothetical protein